MWFSCSKIYSQECLQDFYQPKDAWFKQADQTTLVMALKSIMVQAFRGELWSSKQTASVMSGLFSSVEWCVANIYFKMYF